MRTPETPLSLIERAKRPLALINILGAVALGAGPNTVRYAQPMSEVGYNTNEIWVPSTDIDRANKVAGLAAASGATRIRGIGPITSLGSILTNDWERYCTAEKVAKARGLSVRWAFDFYSREKSAPPWPSGKQSISSEDLEKATKTIEPKLGGYFPDKSNEYERLRTAWWYLASHFIAGTCEDEQGQPIKVNSIKFSINEPNYKKRYPYPDMARRTADALIYNGFMIRKEAAERGVTADIGFDLNTSDQNDPIGFINDVADRFGERRVSGLPITEIGLNFYGAGQSTSEDFAAQSKVVRLEKIAEAIKSRFGDEVKIVITEAGFFSDTPDEHENEYSEPVRPTVKLYPGTAQGKAYIALAESAACAGVRGFFPFPIIDNAHDGMRSGIYTPKLRPKSSTAMVINLQKRLMTPGAIACPK